MVQLLSLLYLVKQQSRNSSLKFLETFPLFSPENLPVVQLLYLWVQLQRDALLTQEAANGDAVRLCSRNTRTPKYDARKVVLLTGPGACMMPEVQCYLLGLGL
jgi:hypothetical protein